MLMSSYVPGEMTRIKHGNQLNASVMKYVGEHALISELILKFIRILDSDGQMDRCIDRGYIMK